MTTEDDFRKQIDEHPKDYQTRLVFADWLQERGDPRAEGYRALGVLRVAPYDEESGAGWKGYGRTNNATNPLTAPGGAAAGALLPPDWFEAVRDANEYPRWTPHAWAYWRSRREAEDAAALAFAKLPPERRAELLAGPPRAEKSERPHEPAQKQAKRK